VITSEHQVPTPPRPSPEAVAATLAQLRDTIGQDRVLQGHDVLDQHARDESFHPPAQPDAVVAPRSVDEVVTIVRAAAATRVPVVPFGAGTSLEGHVMALAGGLSIDMREMNRVTRVSLADLDVTVEAGVTRLQLDARLRPEGVFFPVDPGADATIGGMIATAASGTTTVRYGAMRENVIGLTVVTGEGQVVRTHSRARKSAAGYDLTRLMIGSEGTLAIICEATLRLHPTPAAVAAAACTFDSVTAAVSCAAEVSQYGIPVARMELADELQVQAINAYDNTQYASLPTLFFEFHGGSDAEVEAHATETRDIAAGHGARDFRWAADESERRALWRARHRAFDATRALRPGSQGMLTDVCVPISALAECVVAAQQDIAECGLTATIVGHVGDGNFHSIVLLDPDDPDEVARAEAFHTRLVERAIAVDGTCTGEHGVGYGKARFLVGEHGAAGVAMMGAIKEALDPRGILNPGKGASVADAH
jgi:D-lactate dehydrogenase (cytochrome)